MTRRQNLMGWIDPEDRPTRLEADRDEAEMAAERMTPDEMLRLAHEAIAEAEAAPTTEAEEEANRGALFYYQALDGWLSNGGHRPAAWIPTGRDADVGHDLPDLPDDELPELLRQEIKSLQRQLQATKDALKVCLVTQSLSDDDKEPF